MKLKYKDLYELEQLTKLDDEFIKYLCENDCDLSNQYLKARHAKILKDDQLSLQIAPIVEEFLIKKFGLENAAQKIYSNYSEYALIALAKRQFVQRYAVKKHPTPEPEWHLLYEFKSNFDFAKTCLEALNNNLPTVDALAKYAAWATISDNGKELHKNSLIFCLPEFINQEFIINNVEKIGNGYCAKNTTTREGFALTDTGMNNAKAACEAHYCIICHNQSKDSCRTGLKNTNNSGCPLDQNISVMHALKRDGLNIASLAVVMVDNPMVAATGHRVCNDCMAACIFQKQAPVNTPAVETNILQAVLEYSYGFEIYSLLTRWNPLNFAQPLPKTDSGYKLLVVGLGPSGFSMAHYLARDGHFVLGIDGSKLEPLPNSIMNENLVSDVNSLYENLDDRILWGFGGVAEYGITVRWNKNFLKILRIILERNHNIKFLGSARFGSQINNENIKPLGFDEVVFCTGAGSPKIANLIGNQLPGVRLASDFLMNLQLTGAFRKDLLANLQLLTPIVVIGGGLSAIDAATEAKAYFKVQREKFFKLYNYLLDHHGAAEVQKWWSPKDFAAFENLKNNLEADVRIIYRGDITKSPSYKQNAQEIRAALEEGIIFQDNTIPLRFTADENGWVDGIWVDRNNREEFISAKSVMLAVGTEHSEINHPFTYGDANPDYAGSVVKAIASAKHGYVNVVKKLEKHTPLHVDFNKELFESTIVSIKKLTANTIELSVHSPLAALAFKPGQFYKLQNFETDAPTIADIKMVMEPIALTPKSVDKKTGIISFVVVIIGSSTAMVAYLKKGEKISLMGPVGAPIENHNNKNILLIGGGQFNLGMIEVAQELKNRNNKIFWLAGYRNSSEMLYIDAIKDSAEKVWICIQNNQSSDFITGTVVDGIKYLHQNSYLETIEKVFVYGTTPMQKAVKNTLIDMNFNKTVLCNMNLSMQCMMQGICGQCLHIDEKNTQTFCCKNQDLNLENISFNSVENRSNNNGLLEKVTKIWLSHMQA
jgi:NADPH-dependent glutamate synthase beta subunit-like oxidoreductase/NAD(P)H-flavin reductase